MDIIVVLDESGSMDVMKQEPVQAMNNLIKKQKENHEDCKFSLYTFNNTVNEKYKDVNLSDIKEYKDYSPDGMTALYDCIGHAIDDKMKTDRKTDVILVIITDGQDNSSHKYTCKQIKNKIKSQENDYNWKVMFLAANQDAFTSGESIGVQRGNSSQYNQAEKGSFLNVVKNCSATITRYRVNNKRKSQDSQDSEN